MLGSWCYIKDLIKDNKNIKIMDNKIEKQDLMHKESKLIYEIYTNTIKDLTNFLNKYHNLKWDQRAWKLYFGFLVNQIYNDYIR